MTHIDMMTMITATTGLVVGDRVRVNLGGSVVLGTLADHKDWDDLPAVLVIDAEASADFKLPAQRVIAPWAAVYSVRPA